MAQRGAEIQSSGPQNVAQSTLGLKGGNVPQNILVPDLLGTIELGRRNEPELLFSQGIVPWRAGFFTGAGGAGTFATVELLNPEGYINVFWVSMNNATNDWQVVLGIPAVGAPTAFPIVPVDLRIGRAGISPPAGAVVPIINVNFPAAVIGANIAWQNAGAHPYSGDLPIGPFIAGPESDVGLNHWVIECRTANQGMELNLQGYSVPERVT